MNCWGSKKYHTFAILDADILDKVNQMAYKSYYFVKDLNGTLQMLLKIISIFKNFYSEQHIISKINESWTLKIVSKSFKILWVVKCGPWWTHALLHMFYFELFLKTHSPSSLTQKKVSELTAVLPGIFLKMLFYNWWSKVIKNIFEVV